MPVTQAEKALNSEGPASGAEGAAGNAYIEVVQKRLRALNKRMAKIVSYEDILRKGEQKLQKDQEEAVAKKEIVEELVKELTTILKQQTAHEAEESKASKKAQRRKQVEDRQQGTTRATAVVSLHAVLDLLRAKRELLTSGDSPILSAADAAALEAFAPLLCTSVADGARSAAVASAANHLAKYCDGSAEEAVAGVRYSRVAEIVAAVSASPLFTGAPKANEAAPASAPAAESAAPAKSTEPAAAPAAEARVQEVAHAVPAVDASTEVAENAEVAPAAGSGEDSGEWHSNERERTRGGRGGRGRGRGRGRGGPRGGSSHRGEGDEGAGAAAPTEAGEERRRGGSRGGRGGRGRGGSGPRPPRDGARPAPQAAAQPQA